MKKIIFAICAVAATAASAAKVKSVSVRVSDGFGGDTSDVLSCCETREGVEYGSALCARDVSALRSTGHFDEVFVETRQDGDDVHVTYVIRRKLRFAGPLIVEGNEFWRKSKIEHLADLKDGQYIDDSDLAKAAGKVRDEYRKNFFLSACVDVQVEPVPGGAGSAAVRFKINEGVRTKMRGYEFTGNDSIPSKELRATFGKHPWWNPLGWFTDDGRQITESSIVQEDLTVTARWQSDEGGVTEPDVTDEESGDMGDWWGSWLQP